MAIAFRIDPERGYVPVNVQQQYQPPPPGVQSRAHNLHEGRLPPSNNDNENNNNRRHVNLNVEIDENNNHVIPDLIHGVANFPRMGALGQSQPPPPPPTLSRERLPMTSSTLTERHNFMACLSMEWLSIQRFFRCLSWLSGSIPSDPLTNDGFTARGSSSESGSQGDSLPDLIPCHHGFSLDLSFETCRVYGSRRSPIVTLDENSNNETPRQRCRHPAGRHHHPIPLGPTMNHPSQIIDPEEDEWNIELKVEVNPGRQAGEDLRRIGDQFQFEFESSLQRSLQRESLHVRCVLTLTTLPTLALVGVITGLTYFRRHI